MAVPAKKDSTSKIWDKFWSGKAPNSIYPPVTDIIGELCLFIDIPSKKILEVGAGTGRDGIKMGRGRGDVYLLDYSKESLRLMRQYIKKDEAKLILADALHCPFMDNSFDVVFHQGLLEHFPSPFELLRENYRILKKGGLLVVDVPQTYHFYTILKRILIFFHLWFAGWERQFTISSLTRLLKMHNFEPIHYYGDWSRPGIMYKIAREVLNKFGIKLPMFPKYFGRLTDNFYKLQGRLRKKRLFLYTILSIGIIAKKVDNKFCPINEVLMFR